MPMFIIPWTPTSDRIELSSPKALSKRCLNFEVDKIHPISALTTKTIRLSTTLNAMVDELKTAHHNKVAPFDATRLTKAFEALCYSATEWFDIFSNLVPSAIIQLKQRNVKLIKKSYQEHIKHRRDTWAGLCNAIKHGNRQLFPLEFQFSETKKSVFGFYVVKNETLTKLAIDNNIFHKKDSYKSFNTIMRQLGHDIFCADNQFAKLIALLEAENCQPQQNFSISMQITDSMKFISEMPLRGFPKESRFIDGFTLEADNINFHKQEIDNSSQNGQVIETHTYDGVTKQFPLALYSS